MNLIPIAKIYPEPDAWPRERLDTNRVQEFVDLYRDGGLEALPPLELVVDGDGDYLLADGHHRYEALLQLGLTEAIAIVMAPAAGQDPADLAFLRGLETAATTSKPLSAREKKSAASRLIEESPERSDREIARLVGLSHQTVGRLRRGATDAEDAAAEAPSPEQSIEELARRLAASLGRIWYARGLTDVLLGDRVGRRLAWALADLYGPEAKEWAARLASWTEVALADLGAAGR